MYTIKNNKLIYYRRIERKTGRIPQNAVKSGGNTKECARESIQRTVEPEKVSTRNFKFEHYMYCSHSFNV